MVDSIFQCPTPSVLGILPALDCMVQTGNIIAVALQMKQAEATFTAQSIALQATWTPLVSDATVAGIRVIPSLKFETTSGEIISEGGNTHETHKGRPKVRAVGFSTGTYTLEGVNQAYVNAVHKFTPASTRSGQRSSLTAYFLTDENFVISGADFKGIEIFNHIVLDAKKGGSFKPTDDYVVSFGMDAHWSKNTASTKASFNLDSLITYL